MNLFLCFTCQCILSCACRISLPHFCIFRSCLNGLPLIDVYSAYSWQPQVQRPGELRGVLGRLVQQVCKCATSKHGRASHHGRQCLRQFRDHVQPLFQLRVRLGQLSKQDMDNEALDFSVIARQLVHQVNPPEILRAIHLVGRVMMCHDMIRELYSSVLIM